MIYPLSAIVLGTLLGAGTKAVFRMISIMTAEQVAIASIGGVFILAAVGVSGDGLNHGRDVSEIVGAGLAIFAFSLIGTTDVRKGGRFRSLAPENSSQRSIRMR